jgi:hypothetical protein
VRLERPPLVGGEWPGDEAANGHAVEPVAEHEVLGHPITSREQSLLDLCRAEAELGGSFVDPQAV